MRKLNSSLSLLAFLLPGAAFAQEAVALDEAPAGDAAAAPAPAPAAGEPTPAEPAPAPATDASLQASGSTTGAMSATAAIAPPAPAATEEAPAARPGAATRGGAADSDTWSMSYSGYFRAPMRIGISDNTGPQHVREAGRDADGELLNPEGQVVTHEQNAAGEWVADGNVLPKKITMHRPVIPDDQYASWQFTAHNRNDWAEMFFTVGNGTVGGTLAIQGFQFTDTAWKENNTQFGISQGWVEVNHDLGFENMKFNVKVGSHWARYGLAGVYDAGEYDTYLFGRTHLMGGTARVDLTLSSFDLAFEGGFGAKNPDPSMYNRARFTTAGHGHVFLTFPAVEFSGHLMHAWSAQEVVPTYPGVLPGSSGCNTNAPGAQCTIADDAVTGIGAAGETQNARPNGTELRGGIEGERGVWGPEYPNGTQTIVGADARMDLGLFGYLYAGYSHQFLKNALVIDNAIESIHSLGGGNYALGVVDNYLESPYCEENAPNDSCSNGTGQVGTILAQYELGLGNFGIFPGNMDLKAKLYTMVNFVSVDDIEVGRLNDLYGPLLDGTVPPPAGATAKTIDDIRQDGTVKKKFGTDIEFFPLDFMSAAVRFDYLDPHSKLTTDAFSILSPRITFRTKMVTHEQISLQYSRYFYQKRMCEDGDGNVASPADDPFRPGSVYNQTSSDTGYQLRLECTLPPAAAAPPNGFGAHSNNGTAGYRGAPTLVPDENVIKLEASMWW